MHIIDETVVLWLGRVDGNQWEGRGLLESENPAVVSWAESLYGDYRAEAEPLDPARLARGVIGSSVRSESAVEFALRISRVGSIG
jgi:hypothetical protein